MVATRRGKPEDGKRDASPAPPPHSSNGELPKELRRLEIDGKATMRGEAKKAANAPKQTYTWRGAVYEVDETTPQEWIDAEKKEDSSTRPKKRSLADELMDGSMDDPRPAKKRKSGSTAESTPTDSSSSRKRKAEDDQRWEKRRRSGNGSVAEKLENARAELDRQQEDDDEEAEDESEVQSVAQRAQDELEKTRKKTGRPARHIVARRSAPQRFPTRSHRPHMRTREKSPARFNPPKTTTEAVTDLIEDRREEARDEGLQVDPLPAASSEPPVGEPRRESIGYEMLIDLQKLAKVNTDISRLKERYDNMQASKVILMLRARREAKEKDLLEQLTPQTEAHDETNVDVTTTNEEPAAVNETIEQQNDEPPAAEDDLPEPQSIHAQLEAAAAMDDIPSEPAKTLSTPTATPDLESDRHDSAAGSVASTRTTIDDTVLPATNLAGHPLRWSIGEAGGKLRLSEHRQSEDRAESRIHLGRMAGESKQARRRRVRREYNQLRKMGDVVEDL